MPYTVTNIYRILLLHCTQKEIPACVTPVLCSSYIHHSICITCFITSVHQLADCTRVHIFAVTSYSASQIINVEVWGCHWNTDCENALIAGQPASQDLLNVHTMVVIGCITVSTDPWGYSILTAWPYRGQGLREFTDHLCQCVCGWGTEQPNSCSDQLTLNLQVWVLAENSPVHLSRKEQTTMRRSKSG